MKKFNFTKIVSLALVCAMLMGAFMFTTFAADEATVEIVAKNVWYGEKYQLMFAYNAPAGATVSATVNGKPVAIETYELTKEDEVDADYAYMVSEGVAAQAIDTVVTFTVAYGEETATVDYSVLQYVYERTAKLNAAEQTDEVKNELAMFNALIAYANAANVFIDKDSTNFNDYKYVTVVGGTFDGNNATGMFLPGATPFANIAANSDYDSSAYNVEWDVSVNGAEAVRYTNDQIKTLEITDKTTVTRVLVESAHNHTWDDGEVTTPATCTTAGVLTKSCTYPGCTEKVTEEIPATGEHNYVEGVCSMCGENEPVVGYAGKYVIATIRSSGNYWYMTNDLGSGSTARYTAVDSGLKTLPESVEYANGNYIFVLESNNDGTYSIYAESVTGDNKYLGWSSGNSGTLVAADKALKLAVECDENGLFNIHFTASDAERYLALNQTSGSDYFAFYKSGQKQNLVLIPVTVGACQHINKTTTTTDATCTMAGATVVSCDDCGMKLETTVIDATGHTTDNGTCGNCGAEIGGATESTVVLEITVSDFNTTSYTANNNTKTENGYAYTSNQVMNQQGAMQWQKSKGYITIASNVFSKLEMKVTAGTFTVTVGGKAVTGTTANGVTTYDLSDLSGEVKISVGSATGKVDYLKFYN